MLCTFIFRYSVFLKTKENIEKNEGMDKFSSGYKEFGIHVDNTGSIHCKEWAPAAKAMYLRGQFSKLNISKKIYMIKNQLGFCFQLFYQKQVFC